MQDFSPWFFCAIVEIGSRLFYSLDATEEAVWPTGSPTDLGPFDNVGVIFEIVSGPAVADFYVEYLSAALLESTAGPVAAIPAGPLEGE